MKILYYNWVDYLDDEKRGGGVSIYQRNLVRAFAVDPEADVWFISSGISYDMLTATPRWDKVRHGPDENRSRRFEIVNSGTLSPSHHSFGNSIQVDHAPTVAAFFDFIETNGPFDVVHFNNLEGIPAQVLSLKERWPETRVVLSLHNYYPFCAQVNLWFQEKDNCTDFDHGRKCSVCLPPGRADERVIRLANTVAFNLKKRGVRPGTAVFDRLFSPAMRGARKMIRVYMRLRRRKATVLTLQEAPAAAKSGPLMPLKSRPRLFVDRRRDFVAAINKYCDRVLCVSVQVGRIAARHGIDQTLLRTSYIGTNHADNYLTSVPRPSILREDGTVSLGYLGYMRRDKGFYFLLNVLESLPRATSERLHLVFAAKNTDNDALHRLRILSESFASVSFADGYTHDNLDDLLQSIDVGVIPVLWEDNLPQVAIEMHSRHIPLLTSDLGGAQELGDCPEMVFKAGNANSLVRRIDALLGGEITSETYWSGKAMAPLSMPEHVDQLRVYYGIAPDTSGTLDLPGHYEAIEVAEEPVALIGVDLAGGAGLGHMEIPGLFDDLDFAGDLVPMGELSPTPDPDPADDADWARVYGKVNDPDESGEDESFRRLDTDVHGTDHDDDRDFRTVSEPENQPEPAPQVGTISGHAEDIRPASVKIARG